MPSRQWLGGFCAVAATLMLTPMEAQKKPPTGVTPVTCMVTIDDQVNFDGGDPEVPAIMSDGRGPYVDGQGGVLCNIVNAPGQVHDGWLWLRFSSSRSTRYIWYPGQGQSLDGAPGYNGFQARGSFEVKEFASQVSAGGDTFDVLPFRATGLKLSKTASGQFDGDSNFTGYGRVIGTSSVFVSAHDDNCTWDVWFDPSAPETTEADGVQLGEREDLLVAPRRMVLDDGALRYFAMPFRARVTAISGRTCTQP